MLFITNRVPKQSYKSKKGRKLTFDLQNTDISKHLYFCERDADTAIYTEVMHKAFFEKLKGKWDDSRPNQEHQILLYIHGFNNTDEKHIFPNAIRLQQLLDQEAGRHLVTVVPIIWPCDDDPIYRFVDDYWDDQKAANMSGSIFARLFSFFQKWQLANTDDPCFRRINVLAHSMGSRVLQEALYSWAENGNEVPLMFRNVFLAAPDVKNHTFERGERGEHIPSASKNTVVYFAADDLAMPASKLANTKNRTLSRRLGMTGPEDFSKIPNNVYEVDCHEFNNTLDKPMGHGYFLDNNDFVSPIIPHMEEAIRTGRVTTPRRYEFDKPE